MADVEVVEGDREGEEDEQVEVAHRGDAAEVRQPEQEDDAKREPDPRVVDPAPEGTVVAARHLPGDLRARPGLGHRPGLVVDLRVDDLARVGEVGPDLHRPGAGVLVEGRLLRQAFGRVAICPVCDLRIGEDGGDRFLVGELGRGRLVLGDERRADEVAVRVVDRRLRIGRGRARRYEGGEREEES